MRWAADHLDYRCAVSEDAAATAQAALGGEYEVVFNGIDIEGFAKVEPWPTEAPTIFFVGRHEPRKGLGVLLEALRSIETDFRLWVGGEGEETAELQAKTARDARVEWLGSLHDLDPVFKEFSRTPELRQLFADLGIEQPLLLQSMYIFKQPNIGGQRQVPEA